VAGADLIAKLRRMSSHETRHNYDVGDFWNAVDDAADALETLAAEFKDFIAWVDHHGDFRNGVTDGDRLHIDEGNILYGGRREEALQTIANLQKPSN
jgi:hypothetical protein